MAYSDPYSTFWLDCSIRIQKSSLVAIEEFTQKLHHRSQAFLRRQEGLQGKNTLGLKMIERALHQGMDVDYLLCDSWYAKPDFFAQTQAWNLPTIARVARNDRLWRFEGKRRTLEGGSIITNVPGTKRSGERLATSSITLSLISSRILGWESSSWSL